MARLHQEVVEPAAFGMTQPALGHGIPPPDCRAVGDGLSERLGIPDSGVRERNGEKVVTGTETNGIKLDVVYAVIAIS